MMEDQLNEIAVLLLHLVIVLDNFNSETFLNLSRISFISTPKFMSVNAILAELFQDFLAVCDPKT